MTARISIHAPQWGATVITYVWPGTTGFQSTHPSGVRPERPWWHRSLRPFQSTHPSGVRRRLLINLWSAPCISIHAPQWGATERGQLRLRSFVISIHAPQWGATSLCWDHPSSREFQSTHPSGVRRAKGSFYRADQADFNPRTPVGCDVDAKPSRPLASISIHAPQWGATASEILWAMVKAFQSTHPSGVRHHPFESRLVPLIISIHAPQWGATESCRDGQAYR